MNKLTTTITKAAPLGILALAMSGSAFAGGPKGNGSIEALNICEVIDVFDSEGTPHPTLRITTTITDTSDDTPGLVAELGQLTVQAKQKGPRGPWSNLGAPDPQQANMPETITSIDLCSLTVNPLEADSTVLNADIGIEVLNGRKDVSGKCDDDPSNNVYDEDGNLIYYEHLDESIVDVMPGICAGY